MINLAIFLVLFSVMVGFYNARYRRDTSRMIEWLKEQLEIIKQEPDYRQETELLEDVDIPQAEIWFDESLGFIIPIFIVFGANVAFLLLALIGSFSDGLNFAVATGNAALFVSIRTLYKRRWTVEGTCHGVKAVVDSIDIMKSHDSVDESS